MSTVRFFQIRLLVNICIEKNHQIDRYSPHPHWGFCWELVKNVTIIVIHLFYFIDSNGEILAPLIDVVHQTEGQILEQNLKSLALHWLYSIYIIIWLLKWSACHTLDTSCSLQMLEGHNLLSDYESDHQTHTDTRWMSFTEFSHLMYTTRSDVCSVHPGSRHSLIELKHLRGNKQHKIQISK